MKGFQKTQMLAEAFRFAGAREIGENTIAFFEFKDKKKEVVSIGMTVPHLMMFSVSAQHMFEKLAMQGVDVNEIREIAGVEPTLFEIHSGYLARALHLLTKQIDTIDLKDLFCEVMQSDRYLSDDDAGQAISTVFEALAAAEAEQEGR